MHRLRPVLILLVAALLAVAAWYYFSGRSAASGELVLSGNIEVDDAALSFQVPGRIIERPVEEGQQVAAGELIARLEASDYEQQLALRRAEVALAEAQLAELQAGTRPEQISAASSAVSQARAQLSELEHGSRDQEIARGEAALQQAQADYERANAEVELRAAEMRRYSELYDEGVIAEQQYDTIATAHAVAAKNLEAAETRVNSAKQALSLLQEGPRSEQIDQARAALGQASAMYQEALNGPRPQTIEQAQARVDMAQQMLALAETQLARSTLSAPSAGVILSKSLEPGEYAQPGVPVVTIGNLEQVYLRAYVSETDLGLIRLGDDIEVTVDSFPDRTYKGTVSFISSEAEFTPKTVQTAEERVKLVYRIKILIPNPELELKPGMPADARLHRGGSK